MNRRLASDWLFTASVAGGLFFSPLLAGIVPATLLRGRVGQVRWRAHHTLMTLAALWGMVVMVIRPTPITSLSYFGYLWLVPILLTVYKPDIDTIHRYGQLIVGLFVLDILFNCFSIATGADLLGRTLDNRDGLLVAARNGGLFAHSFYSGSISIAALIVFLDLKRPALWPALALLNLVAAGSWRLGPAAVVILGAALLWNLWGRRGYAVFIVASSLLIIISVVLTSGIIDVPLDVNLSNTNRLYAWSLAIEKLGESGILGVGLPSTTGIEAVTFEIIDENLIAESWYLGTAMSFGIPYTLLCLSALILAFFGENFDRRGKKFALLMPLIFVDMVAGEFFLGVLIYTWLWLLIGQTDMRVPERKLPMVWVAAKT